MPALSRNSLSDGCCCILTISHIPKGTTEADVLKEIKTAVGESSFILYMPEEKQSGNSGRAYVCFKDAVATMTCFEALNGKRLPGSKSKRCMVEVGLVHRKQAPPGSDFKKKNHRLSQSEPSSSRAPPTCTSTIQEFFKSTSPPDSADSTDVGELGLSDEPNNSDSSDNDLDEVDPDVWSRFESRFGKRSPFGGCVNHEEGRRRSI